MECYKIAMQRIPGKTTIDGSFQMLGERTGIAELTKKRIVNLNPFRYLRQSLTLSHFSKVFFLIGCKPFWAGRLFAAADESKTKADAGIDLFISFR